MLTGVRIGRELLLPGSTQVSVPEQVRDRRLHILRQGVGLFRVLNHGNPVFLIGPSAEIDLLAALTTKRAPGIAGTPFNGLATGWAGHSGNHELISKENGRRFYGSGDGLLSFSCNLSIRYLWNNENMDANIAVAALAALAQSSRLAIFRLLVEAGPEGLAVGKIGERLDITPATLSFHLKNLVQAGLLLARQESRFIYYSANYTVMDDLIGFLTDNCCNGGSCLPKTAAIGRKAKSATESQKPRSAEKG